MNTTEELARFLAVDGDSPRMRMMVQHIAAASKAELPTGDVDGLLRVLVGPMDFSTLKDTIWTAAIADIDWQALPELVKKFEADNANA